MTSGANMSSLIVVTITPSIILDLRLSENAETSTLRPEEFVPSIVDSRNNRSYNQGMVQDLASPADR